MTMTLTQYVRQDAVNERINELEQTISALEEARDSAEEAAELLQEAGLQQMAETASDFASTPSALRTSEKPLECTPEDFSPISASPQP